MKKFYYTLALIFLPLIALADPPLGSACWRANGTNSAYDGNDGFNCPHEVSQKRYYPLYIFFIEFFICSLSSSERLYLSNSWLSISSTDLVQSISESLVNF